MTSAALSPAFRVPLGIGLHQHRRTVAKSFGNHMHRAAGIKLPPDVLAHRSRLGGIARGQKLSAERLSEIGRNAINERWRRAREAMQAFEPA
jgi:hypothetical protein